MAKGGAGAGGWRPSAAGEPDLPVVQESVDLAEVLVPRSVGEDVHDLEEDDPYSECL